MKIVTNKETIKASQEVIYNFLVDMHNFKELLPQEKISDWTGNVDSCSFKIKNMGTIELKKVACTPHSLIYLDSFGKTPFKFTLNIFLSDKNNDTIAHLEFEGDINPFMKMMIEKPLTEFFNGLVKKLITKYETN